jgi:thiol-disulfide isomerase/thioredoxin
VPLHTRSVTAANRRWALAATTLAAAVALGGCAGGNDAVDQQAGGQFRYVQSTHKGSLIPVASRKPAGNVTGELLAGGTYQLAADRGSVVVLNFFATWCGPCQTETPQLDALYRQRRATGVKFVGIDVKDGGRDSSRQWLADKQVSFPIVYDEPAKTALALGNLPILGLPDTVILDRRGRVAAVYAGAVLPADLTPALDRLDTEAP